MKFRIEHRFTGVDVDRFVEIYYSEAFNQSVAPISGMKERRLVEESTDGDGKIHRRVRLVPAVPIPAAFEKLIAGRAVTYDEVSVYDPKTKTARYRIDHKAGDRLRAEGTNTFVQDGPGAVKRIIDGEVEVRVFGVGALVERFIENEVKKGYDAIASFLQGWIDRHR